MYINCDGSMDYTPGSQGGIGFNISFPDSIRLEPIPISQGTYQGANIEMLEIEALINAMEKAIEVWNTYEGILTSINRIILVTDRYGLKDSDKTSAYRIKKWRHDRWKNHEQKPIKNHKQLDMLDKVRRKLVQVSGCPVEITYKRRKENKVADKLAKAGKKNGLTIDKLKKKGEKIGKRKFDGSEMPYKSIKVDTAIHVNIFRKDPVQHQWEVWVEICAGEWLGRKFKIYTDNLVARSLSRGNEYVIKVKQTLRYFVRIYDEVQHVAKGSDNEGPEK